MAIIIKTNIVLASCSTRILASCRRHLNHIHILKKSYNGGGGGGGRDRKDIFQAFTV